jgi:hypothetical protein
MTLEDKISDEDLRQRIREVLGDPRPKSWLSKCMSHSLTALVVGFALTTVAGTCIANDYQTRAEQQKRDAERREARRAAAMTTFQEVGRLMDRRLFWTAQLYDAVRTDQSDTAPQRRRRLLGKYAEARDAWRESFLTNAASVCRHFGVAPGRIFADSIAGLFSRFGRGATELAAEAGRNPRAVIGRAEYFPLYDSLRTRIFEFNLELVDMIKSDSAMGGSGTDACRNVAPNDPVQRAP